MKKSELKRKKPLQAKATLKTKPKAKKKVGLKPDGTPKRGYTKSGKPSMKSRGNTADSYARKYCHSMGYCEACGYEKMMPPKSGMGAGGACYGELEWAHIWVRKHKVIRWHPENCLCLCHGCHTYYEGKAEFGLLVEKIYPGRLERLAEYEKTHKVDPDYWIGYYKELGVKTRGDWERKSA